jgi:hypothetical protein
MVHDPNIFPVPVALQIDQKLPWFGPIARLG